MLRSGGNSTKATSGINGAGTNTQAEEGIKDSAQTFFNDTKKSVSLSLSLFLFFLPFGSGLVMGGRGGWDQES